MANVKVIVPLLKGKRRFHLEKGRSWSLVEHSILVAVSTKPRKVDSLATVTALSRRLIVEALIRLMKAGWVELTQSSDGILFKASNRGLSIVDRDELPSATFRTTRWISFVIEQVSGTVYRSREIPYFEKHMLLERAKVEKMVWLDAREIDYDESSAFVSTLLDEDERFISVEPTGERMVERFGMVSVSNEVVDGLPNRAPRALRKIVLDAARIAPVEPSGQAFPVFHVPESDDRYAELPEVRRVSFRRQDLIVGGTEHRELLERAIKKARSRLIIHSTFISLEKFQALKGSLFDAAYRGVIVDILWGEDEDKSEVRSTRIAVEEIRKEISRAGLTSNLRVYTFSTYSHAKILIADQGNMDFIAVVGSCNWLSTSFRSFEVSLLMRDPKVVADLLIQVAELSRGIHGHWTQYSNEIAEVSTEVATGPQPKVCNADVSIVLGPQHGQYILNARDNASRRLFVMSHRLGAATRTAVIVPAVAVTMARGVDVRIYYGIATSPVGADEVSKWTIEANRSGVEVRPIHQPRIHAKVLVWDDDYLLVTSQNWLSADPSDSNRRREIGIFLTHPGVGKSLIAQFEAQRVISTN